MTAPSAVASLPHAPGSRETFGRHERSAPGIEIRAGFRIAYDCPRPTPMLLMLDVHPSRRADLVGSAELVVDPPLAAPTYTDAFGNICRRIVAPPGRSTLSSDFVIRDSGLPDPVAPKAMQHDVADLPNEVLVYLLGSRYCETDKLAPLAWQLFSGTPAGWPRVQAICDYVHDRIRFDYQLADCTRSASEAHEQGVGVCRDYTHLAVAFCRAMNIPARYCTGYLGDIGIPPQPYPMDFSAWFEVFLSGRWWAFDARHNTPRIGRILIAAGRDATDVAISTAFGATGLPQFEVTTDEVR